MRIETEADVMRLIAEAIPEAPSLEYKETLILVGRPDRLELLKDLTGMANGGGGTVVFGVRERESEPPAADSITPLTDYELVGRLEDIVRSGVHPPLLMDLRTVEVEGGFVLAIDLERSPLGPYMVQGYGDHRYHVRAGSRTVPMNEQQVRDAYALALRARERRPIVWDEHGLPLKALSDKPSISVSALPEEPLREVLDLARAEPQEFAPPSLIAHHLQLSDYQHPLSSLNRWSHGLFGETRYTDDEPPPKRAQLHRDGATGFAAESQTRLTVIAIARLVNAQLAYLAWFWSKVGLGRPIELVIGLSPLEGCSLDISSWYGDLRTLRQPTGVRVEQIRTQENTLPWELGRASQRHRIVQRFADRIYQAFGFPQANALFTTGQLYGPRGRHLDLAITGAGVWDSSGGRKGYVRTDSSIAKASGDVISFIADGVVIDEEGNTLGVLEMAPGRGCPDDFMAAEVILDPRARLRAGSGGSPERATYPIRPPTPTGAWSELSLAELIAP